jgi:hypothetical protein
MAKKEYIERNELIRYAEVELRMQGDLFRRAVESCPTADVVEVVRCRDCKYGETSTCPITGVELFICRHGHLNRAVEKDHFCSYGERREQG